VLLFWRLVLVKLYVFVFKWQVFVETGCSYSDFLCFLKLPKKMFNTNCESKVRQAIKKNDQL